VIAGALASAVGLGAVSVLTEGPGAPPPQTGQVDVPAGSEFTRPRDDTEAALPEASTGPEPSEAPQVTAPEPDDLASLEGAVTESAVQPEASAPTGALDVPGEGAEDSGVALDSETPVLPSPQAMAPQQPASEQDLSISTDPAQPQQPAASEESAFPQAPDEAVVVEETGAVPSSDDGGDMSSSVQPEPEAPNAAAEDAAETTPAPDPSEKDPVAEAADAPLGDPASSDVVSDAEDGGSGTIGNLATGVTTNRLPSVGEETEEADAADDSANAATPDTAPAESAAQPPLIRYGAAFENPEGKPLMSVILIDDGSSPIGFQALESFPYPLSFAVDAQWEGAAEAMAVYRAAGFDVLAMVDLPDGAGAQDTEVAMQSVFGKLPEVVAVMDGSNAGLQASRAAAEQLAPILLDSGHGAVFFPKGLNTAQQLLAREGVPAVSVFRDFDANGQSATVIRRFLDQAAFKAGQEDAGVVMVGRLRPDTVSALLLWGLQDRATRVALAPISAMLRGE